MNERLAIYVFVVSFFILSLNDYCKLLLHKKKRYKHSYIFISFTISIILAIITYLCPIQCVINNNIEIFSENADF
jgi:hypothetical protein